MQNFEPHNIRNIAIIAHVDHGKTTLVDALLKQTDTVNQTLEHKSHLIMDHNDLERERGMTILAKNTSLTWKDCKINIVDTPGHADFSGEVERILSMVDSVLLVVDSVDGPMPQTRYVTEKAFGYGLKPIVVINKIDRPQARPDWVCDQVFDLFDKLGASDQQLDFMTVYTSALNGTATTNIEDPKDNMHELLDLIVNIVPAPRVDPNGSTQIQVSSLDYSSFLGTIGVGRLNRGSISKNQTVTILDRHNQQRTGKISQVMTYHGLQRSEIQKATAGDIIAIAGIESISISETICDTQNPEALPSLELDPPTVSVFVNVNDSPFAGREGKFVTSRQIWARLEKEVKHNIALKIEQTDSASAFKVSGRGELHISILLETMRREGFEIAVSRPKIIFKTIDDVVCEPLEEVIIDVDTKFQGDVIAGLGSRGGILKNLTTDVIDRSRIEFEISSRNLIGFHSEFMNISSGTGILNRRFTHYAKKEGSGQNKRIQGVLIANISGETLAYSLWNLQPRGRLFVNPQQKVYEGMIIGIHSRDNDLVVNPCRAKKLTNIRAAGTDENIQLTTPINLSLEYALEFIEDDELVEITPENIRVRKRFLLEHQRKRKPVDF